MYISSSLFARLQRYDKLIYQDCIYMYDKVSINTFINSWSFDIVELNVTASQNSIHETQDEYLDQQVCSLNSCCV